MLIISFWISGVVYFSIIYKISEFKKTQVIRNRHILMQIMETLLRCGKQNIAIRGQTPERRQTIADVPGRKRNDY
jgi:hypothetical protein